MLIRPGQTREGGFVVFLLRIGFIPFATLVLNGEVIDKKT
jgi:hypothetical protein